MTNSERSIIIENAINEYRAAVKDGDKTKIERAINMMGNVYIMTSGTKAKGVENLRQTLNEAIGKYERTLYSF